MDPIAFPPPVVPGCEANRGTGRIPMSAQRSVGTIGWWKRGLTMLAGLALSGGATTGAMVPGPPYMIVGIDGEGTWDETGKVQLLPAGKDPGSVVGLINPKGPRDG